MYNATNMDRIFIKEAIKQKGEDVKVTGWISVRRDHGKIIFIDLIDATGILQVVFIPSAVDLFKKAETLRPNDVIEIAGVVKERPPKMVNPNIESGKVEMEVKDLNILTRAETTPFDVSTDGREVGEENRLKYRYLDLRRQRLQKNLRKRHKAFMFIRNYLTEKGFAEIETPILTKSTPEGARDYVVPSRLHPGKFYALPQSPQQYKQLLMVAGMERYFQIARCFRDEDTRGDRQPEFTQLDIEMSFVKQEDILNLIENLFISLVKNLYPEKKITKEPWPRLTYKEADEKYHSDKPDLRESASGGKNNPNELAFTWITDFPAFEYKESEKRWDAVHHPFTMPQTDDINEIKKDPGKILAFQYDLVLNGFEVGGGSIRIHKPELLQAIFEFMGHSKKEIHEKFGHLLQAFKYGVPPHGGIAAGLDRLMMILENEPSIREVIAFPKTGDGRDLMMDSPSEISKEQLKELRISPKEGH